MNKIISIIVPSYNMELFLERGLNSLIVSPKMLEKIEVLVVNDGSTDSTLQVAMKFVDNYPGIFKIIDKKNGNYGSCINAGLKEASGVFVKILDADDYFITDNFERLIAELVKSDNEHENVDLFFSNWRIVDENDNVTDELFFDIPTNKVIDINSKSCSQHFDSIQHHAIIYRTSFLNENKYVQTEKVSYSDTEWACKPLLFIKRIKYLPIQVYSYLYGRKDQSMSYSSIKKGFKSMLTIENSLLNTYFESKNIVDSIHYFIYEQKLISNLRYFYRNYLALFSNKGFQKDLLDFDNQLLEKAPNIYSLFNDDFIKLGFLKIKYVDAFRKKPNGLKYKIIRFLFGLRAKIKN